MIRHPYNANPLELDDISDLPFHYIQFFYSLSLKIPENTASGTPLHTAAARLRKIVSPHCDSMTKGSQLERRMKGRAQLKHYNDNFKLLVRSSCEDNITSFDDS